MELRHVPKYRVGRWLPSDRDYLTNWIERKVIQANASDKPLHPAIQKLKDLIESDPILYMCFTGMYDDIPQGYNAPIKNFETMFNVMNEIISESISYSVIEDNIGLVGFPINAILDWAMGTQGGYLAFTNEKVNENLYNILEVWKKFLGSSDSRYVLVEGEIPHQETYYTNPIGWFSPAALEALAAADPLRGKVKSPQEAKANFIYNFKCNPKADYWGFKSWDDFFIREFNTGVRPVESPADDNVIVNACESAPYNCQTAKTRDKFWMKGQPYSLYDIMAHDPLSLKFKDNSTVYQAFLCAKSYHRWHSPVNGTIVKAFNVKGTYYAEAPVAGFDPAGPNDSQGYIAEVAARAVIFIEADNKNIGLMCFVAIGMAEVSSCDIYVKKGQHVKKGDPLGTFHFGGSTHCLIFNENVKLKFDYHNQTPGLSTSNIPLSAKIATVIK